LAGLTTITAMWRYPASNWSRAGAYGWGRPRWGWGYGQGTLAPCGQGGEYPPRPLL